MIARGGGYDAVLRWRAAGPEDDIKELRNCDSCHHVALLGAVEIYVGKVSTYTLKDI